MQPAGRNTDLGAHPELATIGELSRSVMQHDSAVDLGRIFHNGSAKLSHVSFAAGNVSAVRLDGGLNNEQLEFRFTLSAEKGKGCA